MEVCHADVVATTCARSFRRRECCRSRENVGSRAFAGAWRDCGKEWIRLRCCCGTGHRQGRRLSRALHHANKNHYDRHCHENGHHRAAARTEAIRKRRSPAAILCGQSHRDARPLPDLERVGSAMDQKHERVRAAGVLRQLYRGSRRALCGEAAFMGRRQRTVLAGAQGARRLQARSLVRRFRHRLCAPRLRAGGLGRQENQTGPE